MTERPSAPRRHSSTSSSADASWRANTNSGSGRNTDSSVIGTGLFENAPYTIADDTITRCDADAAVGVGEQQADRLGDALAPAGSSVVVADAELDDRVEAAVGSARRLAGRDVETVHLGERRQRRGSPGCSSTPRTYTRWARVDAPQHAGRHRR